MWFWAFNGDGDIYSSCWEAYVTHIPTTMPTDVPTVTLFNSDSDSETLLIILIILISIIITCILFGVVYYSRYRLRKKSIGENNIDPNDPTIIASRDNATTIKTSTDDGSRVSTGGDGPIKLEPVRSISVDPNRNNINVKEMNDDNDPQIVYANPNPEGKESTNDINNMNKGEREGEGYTYS